jgi:Domain of unknown function (DUF2017)
VGDADAGLIDVPFRRPVTPLRDGGYRLRLAERERDALYGLCDELRELIEADDDGVARLFPPAYRDDEQASAEYDRLVRGSLTAGKLDSVRVVQETAEAERLDHEQLEAWCSALNDVRLVLGERLGVTEDLYETGVDPRDPRAAQFELYTWLTWLQGSVVEALASRLPDR